LVKGYNELRKIYIKSKDIKTKKEALKKLIECSKKLGRDYKRYQHELYTLLNRKKGSRLSLVNNKLQKVILRKGYIEFLFDYPLKEEDIEYKTILDHKRNNYRYIFDILARFTKKPEIYHLRSIRLMKIAQFDKKHMRIVLQNNKPITPTYKIVGSKLLIYLTKPSPPIKKLSTKTKPTKKEVTKKVAASTAVAATAIASNTKESPKVGGNHKKIIVIDAGHGGRDSGAIGYKRKREKNIVLQIARKVYKKLKALGYKVYLTRSGDYFIPLKNRTKLANRVKANLFISIHANAAPSKRRYLSMKGIETFFLSPATSERAKRIAAIENRVEMKNMSYYTQDVFLNFINREKTIMSNKLAIDIQRNILYQLRKKYRGVIDGGVRPGPFWVLVGAQMPAILVEVGYITNPTEAMRLSNPYYQNLLAEGIVRGIESYFLNNEK